MHSEKISLFDKILTDNYYRPAIKNLQCSFSNNKARFFIIFYPFRRGHAGQFGFVL
ncbi:hypothetical protein CLOSTMETH_00101 [[Clostridium] methylpentosum DSM 5476]|uniref:Uncharacterized protein n=1 Tax=[Clostridium] methylpentosum DSM 5476 TaxID=537013 RepID=C0E8F5_9FIRM|nr:hypothetical protein CLOSTMETH_00101 [[Clostridium] methylpentosum DSM 5476]